MRILILSRNQSLYSTQSLLRACYRRGHYARVIDHLQCDLVVDSNELALFYQGVKIEGYDAVIPRVGSSVTLYGTNVMRQLEMMGTFSVTRAESMLKTRNKWLCYQILASEGIPIPKSLLPNLAQLDEQLIRSNFSQPLIIKMLESTHGLGVILSESYNNACSTIEAFFRMRESVMVQEYIRESRGTDIRVLVVDDAIIASMKRQAKEGEFRSNLHRGATALVEKLTEEERFIARKVCKLLNLQVAGVDLLRSKDGPMVLEINSSPGLEGIETVTGIDVSGHIVKFIERQIRKRDKRMMRKA
ncbi:MAG: RimK family alpha-L-glutamate ligase [Saprospiraceae bacterium]|nr:RimK family alpha-L-glutamate ligase [Saprospiraceae bacterium]